MRYKCLERLKPYASYTGFTMVEMAIVLVIMGLLLGGILKGQAMINNAKVNSLIADVKGIQTAFLAFQDRYHHVPGDWDQASTAIPGAVNCSSNCNTGAIDTAQKSVLAFNHLSAAGFLAGDYSGAGAINTAANSPVNRWGGVMQIAFDGNYATATATSGNTPRHNIKTGNMMPVSVLRELDTKLDNESPVSGGFRFSAWSSGSTAPAVAGAGGCTTNGAAADSLWDAGNTSAASNCGGALLLD
ncbi:type II secretion system protein [Leeia oryzae]|uniref:type II secretion system protein n=1 Tax=Leeia oryzae TaxID=356662 RepID=UPI0003720DCF|nr:prepilin-type N-terminal cleavage/methylation domain-containing protein [Leeia oryzae]